MVVVVCPHCGGEVVAVRAELGMGTRRAQHMRVNGNRQAILDVLVRPMSVRDVQIALVKAGIKRVSRRGAGWNYHTVQADLSNLIGMGFVRMLLPHEREVFDSVEGHTTRGVPLYEKVEVILTLEDL